MRWQEKVQRYLAERGISVRKLAERIDVGYTGFKGVLERESAWETVQRAIRLAQEMGTTVEYLFDPNTDWPQQESSGTPGEVSRQAMKALERMGASEELAKLAGVKPAKKAPRPGKLGKSQRTRRPKGKKVKKKTKKKKL